MGDMWLTMDRMYPGDQMRCYDLVFLLRVVLMLGADGKMRDESRRGTNVRARIGNPHWFDDPGC